MNERDVMESIVHAISDSQFRWRTPRGIAKDTGLPVPKVTSILSKRSDMFVRANKPNSRGESLFSTKEKGRSQMTLGQRVLTALTNKVIE